MVEWEVFWTNLLQGFITAYLSLVFVSVLAILIFKGIEYIDKH